MQESNLDIKEQNRNAIIFLAVIIISFIMVGICGWGTTNGEEEKTPLQECQETYMKSTNVLYKYNEENPKYKVKLPEYDCNWVTNLWTASGAIIPLPPKELDLKSLQSNICKRQSSSPLCNDYDLLKRLYDITESRLPWKNFFPILVWITNAESSLWINFAKDSVGWRCDGRNNWGWTKYQILDNDSRVYKRNLNWFVYTNSEDQFGCNLYPFESIEEFWITKVNGMRYGYKSCVDSRTPVRCLSYRYVGNPLVAEESWIRNVSIFLN